MLLMGKNATVTICHTKTENMPEITRNADIVVTATGKPKAFGASYFKIGQTVIDVGLNVDAEGKMCGDVDFDAVEPIVENITPALGGVGAVTTAVLLSHTVQAAEKQKERI
jgi:methylenetetrahydrofolate dehydrogenase (NADP+)/methenyltetrahydrofolate cyclohydrolase